MIGWIGQQTNSEAMNTFLILQIIYNWENDYFSILQKLMFLRFFLFSENVMAFAWEPTGNKFAFIHGESPRISVSFYNIKPQGGKVEQISKFLLINTSVRSYKTFHAQLS